MFMIDQKQIEVIDLLYKSILTPEKWGGLMDRLTDDLDVFSVNMLLADKVLAELQNSWTSKSLLSNFPIYMEKKLYLHEMPMVETLHQTSQGSRLVHVDEIERSHNQLSDNKLDLSYVNQWVLEQDGITDRFISSLNHHVSHSDHICVCFHQDNKTNLASTVQRGNLYLPHLANLVNVSRPFLLLKARFNAVLDVLDRFKLGVFLLSNSGDLIDKNEAAKNILDQNDGLSLDVKNRMQLSERSANETLYNIIDKVTLGSSQVKGARRARLIAQRPSNSSGLLLEVSALMHYDLPVGALVIVTDPDQKTIIDTSHFTELFGLTPSEQEVCQLLAQGSKSNDIADIRSTTIETSRGQIKSVLSKTKTFQQTELVRLALSINIPVDEKP